MEGLAIMLRKKYRGVGVRPICRECGVDVEHTAMVSTRVTIRLENEVKATLSKLEHGELGYGIRARK